MSARAPYPNALVLLHPAITAAAAEQIARITGLAMRRTDAWNFTLEPVPPCAHVQEFKRQASIAYLRERGKYVLDQGAEKPSWGNGRPPEAA